jgi:hypothetical protein
MSQQQSFGGTSIPGDANIEFIQGNDDVNTPPNPATHILQFIGDSSKGVSVKNTGTYQETVSVAFSTTTSPGVASFNDADFTVTDGLVSLIGSEGFKWNVVTSISPTNPIQIVANNGYICNGTNQVTFILPVAPNIADEFKIISNTSTFQITENGSQQICIGTASSTAGSGNLTSNSTGDQVDFMYMGANIFRGFAPQGTLTLQ